jgi:hypothetical protein
VTHDEFARYYEEWEMRIRSLSRRLSRRDRDLAQDLEQVGRCALWQLELACIKGDEKRYIWRMLRNHMLDVVRRENRARVIVPQWRCDRRRARCKAESASHIPKRRELHKRGAPRHHGAAPYSVEDRAAA